MARHRQVEKENYGLTDEAVTEPLVRPDAAASTSHVATIIERLGQAGIIVVVVSSAVVVAYVIDSAESQLC